MVGPFNAVLRWRTVRESTEIVLTWSTLPVPRSQTGDVTDSGVRTRRAAGTTQSKETCADAYIPEPLDSGAMVRRPAVLVAPSLLAIDAEVPHGDTTVEFAAARGSRRRNP